MTESEILRCNKCEQYPETYHLGNLPCFSNKPIASDTGWEVRRTCWCGGLPSYEDFCNLTKDEAIQLWNSYNRNHNALYYIP